MPRKTKLEIILKGKCPRCHEGDLFQYPLSNIPKYDKTNKFCPKCNLQFEQEPGFFMGAMYVSYAFNVAILVATGIALNVLMENPPLWLLVLVVPSVVLIFLPLIYRYSRILFLHLFSGIKYKEVPLKD